MRKILALTICVAMIVAVFGGCGAAEKPGETTAAPAVEHVLKVGYGRANATPKTGMPYAGGDSSVLPIGLPTEDEYFVTCIALTDENDTTILLYHLDLIYPGATTSYARGRISKETGVPIQNIILATTHNHRAPALDVNTYDSEQYSESYKEWMMEAALAAMEDRKPAKMHIASTNVPNSTFVRHFVAEDGTRGGWSKYGASSVDTVYKADDELQLVKFTREGGKDVVLMNWQGHPMSGARSTTELRSDVDVYRKYLERELDCYFAYFLGASGDLAYDISLKTIRYQDWYTNDYIQRGTELAGRAVEAAATFKEVQIGALQLVTNKTQLYNEEGKNPIDISLSAFSIGDLAFVIVPYEMFGINGSTVKEGSPFEMTFLSTCTNGYASYVVADHAYDYDCYELTRTNYQRGTAERLANEYVSILNQIYNTK